MIGTNINAPIESFAANAEIPAIIVIDQPLNRNEFEAILLMIPCIISRCFLLSSTVGRIYYFLFAFVGRSALIDEGVRLAGGLGLLDEGLGAFICIGGVFGAGLGVGIGF